MDSEWWKRVDNLLQAVPVPVGPHAMPARGCHSAERQEVLVVKGALTEPLHCWHFFRPSLPPRSTVADRSLGTSFKP
jgi:hypothetical protein